MCQGRAHGGRRCPGHTNPAARQAHNERRVENRARRREAVALAKETGASPAVLTGLQESPPSVATEWRSATTAENPLARRFGSLDEKLEAIHGELEAKIADLGNDEQWQTYLDTMSRFHHYSPSNQLLIQIQRPGATLVAGFNKWKDMGRHVQKGERGISILAPKTIREKVLDSNGDPIRHENGRFVKTGRVVGFTSATVFDLAQTDGEDLPRPHTELTEKPTPGLQEDLEAAVQGAGFTIEYAGGMQGDGSSNPTTKVVRINSQLTPAMQAATLAHELGHIKAGHLERTTEYHVGPGGERGSMEVEAESIAYAICRANGMSTKVGDASGTYIAGWAKAAGPDVVKKTAQKVSSVVKQILGEGSWQNMPGNEGRKKS